MTALTQYARIECPGVWRPDPEAQRAEVVVCFGDATLVIADPAGRALAHWSLAAVARINPGIFPALFTPSAEATETLEIADDTMVEAIERVRTAIARARPRSGRVRGLVLMLTLAASVGAAAWWVPGALVRHAVAVLPEPTRAEIGAEIFAALGRVSAGPCHTPRADRALEMLAARLDPARPVPGQADAASAMPVATRALPVTWAGGAAPTGLAVVPDGIRGVRHLPGGIVLIGRDLVEDHEGPEVLAGHLLAAELRAEAEPPLATILTEAGPLATVQLLTTGHLPKEAMARHAEAILRERPADVDYGALVAAFAAADISSTPYAYARDVTGESVLTLIEADPLRGKPAQPLLTDTDWAALQEICEAR